MRISVNKEVFIAEFTPGELWADDQQKALAAGFKTTGPPTWIWNTSKVSVLNKLRKDRPKSGLIITELALQKYKQLNEREEARKAIKKQFEKIKKEAAQPHASDYETYLDEETGITCILVQPCASKYQSEVKVRQVPHEICFVCEGPVYLYEKTYPTPICLYCEKELEET